MKWSNKPNFEGETRVVIKFALFPITADGETVWLEWVHLQQTYSTNYADSGWKNTAFV